MNIRITLALLALLVVPAAAQNDDRQPWKKQLNFDAGILFPGGDAGPSLNTGLGFTGTFYYQLLTRNTFVSVSAGTNSFPYKHNTGINHTVIPILLGMRYNFTLTGLQPYLGVEAGLYLRSNSADDNQISLAESSADFGVMPKVGLRYPLAAGFDLDGSIKWHNVFSEHTLSWFGLNLGIAYTID